MEMETWLILDGPVQWVKTIEELIAEHQRRAEKHFCKVASSSYSSNAHSCTVIILFTSDGWLQPMLLAFGEWHEQSRRSWDQPQEASAGWPLGSQALLGELGTTSPMRRQCWMPLRRPSHSPGQAWLLIWLSL